MNRFTDVILDVAQIESEVAVQVNGMVRDLLKAVKLGDTPANACRIVEAHALDPSYMGFSPLDSHLRHALDAFAAGDGVEAFVELAAAHAMECAVHYT